jgi:hypothetical protein
MVASNVNDRADKRLVRPTHAPALHVYVAGKNYHIAISRLRLKQRKFIVKV